MGTFHIEKYVKNTPFSVFANQLPIAPQLLHMTEKMLPIGYQL